MKDHRDQLVTGCTAIGRHHGVGRGGSSRGVAPVGLRIEADRVEGALVVSVSGSLTFPAAVQLTRTVAHLIGQGVVAVTVLDLAALDDADHTGVAVLVAAARDLKAAGSQVRVVTADRAILARLPYTLGLRRVFSSRAEALSFEP